MNPWLVFACLPVWLFCGFVLGYRLGKIAGLCEARRMGAATSMRGGPDHEMARPL